MNALELETKAAERGELSAMVNLGHRFVRGDGVAEDTEMSRMWFERAASKGSLRGASCLCSQLGRLYRAQRGRPILDRRAAESCPPA